MDHTILSFDERVLLLCANNFRNLLFDVIMTLECEKYWLSICILCVNQRSSIVQLLF